MSRPSPRRSRPSFERLESLDLPSAVAPAPFVNLIKTPVAADAKNFIVASTPNQGRQRGAINALVAVPATGYVAGVATLQYRVKVIPTFLSPFSPTVSFAMRISFATSLADPRPGDVTVTYTKNVVPFGASVRTKVALGVVAFLRRDGAAIAGTLGRT